MNTFSTLRLKIADREYSLRVAPKDEELLRQAGRMLNERIRLKKEKLGIRDKQDLLAMVAFDGLVQELREERKESSLCDRLDALDAMLTREL
jgi:cell division protein ZapA